MIDLYKKCNIKMATQCKVRGFDEKGRLWGQEGIEGGIFHAFRFFFLPSFWGDYPFSRSLSHSHSLCVPLCKPFSSRLEVITSNKTTDSESVRCRTCTRGTHICKHDFTHGVFGAFHDTSRFLDVDRGKKQCLFSG